MIQYNPPISQNPDISIVIPSQNEEDNLPILANEIVQEMELQKYEIIIINHNSLDNSNVILNSIKNEIACLGILEIQDKDMLLGEALREGIQRAKGDFIITMDGDLSHPPKFLPEFIKNSKEYDLVIGGRYQKGQTPFSPRKRYKISKRFNLIPRIFSRKIHDFTTGYRGFSRELYESLHFRAKGFNFHLELNLKLCRKAAKVKEIQIEYIKRVHGQSKLKYFDNLWGYLYAVYLGLKK